MNRFIDGVLSRNGPYPWVWGSILAVVAVAITGLIEWSTGEHTLDVHAIAIFH